MANSRDSLLALIRNGSPMSLRQQLRLTVELSIPAILAQLSAIIMQYIDAAMVGSLGANDSASIGLMATSTWLFWGLCTAVAQGFSVQVAHKIGAAEKSGAQAILRQSILSCVVFAFVLVIVGVGIGYRLPYWLGGTEDIAPAASAYFIIFACSLPILHLNYLAGAMLRCSGNTFFPGMVNVCMCGLDVLFNWLLIFPTREFTLGFMGLPSIVFTLPGAGLGVAGAALGTALAYVVAAAVMWPYLWCKNKELNMKGTHGSFRPTWLTLKRAFYIGGPMGAEHVLLCGAQVLTTVIVAPLGVMAIAANAFAVTAESLCYMPGYGIAEAATVLVGQSLGAARKTLAKSFGKITVILGIAVMTFMGVLMYVGAPLMMGIISPVQEIIDVGVEVLRIETYAEPMFAASIVAYGVFVGAGDTLIPSCMNLGSIWGVRLTLAAILSPMYGLQGVWLAMAIELCFRGMIFLWRLNTRYWISKSTKVFKKDGA